MLPKIPTLAKENSRAWAWALQKNIMGLNFKTYPTKKKNKIKKKLTHSQECKENPIKKSKRK